MPFLVHAANGRGLLKAGNATEAVKELSLAEAAQPGDVEFVRSVVPELEQAGRKADADALFQRVAGRYEENPPRFSPHAQHHNGLAWMAASLGRDLDKALTHAQRAVELEPKNAAFIDTLAEVRFHQGDQVEAVRLMKRCLNWTPNATITATTQRFQGGRWLQCLFLRNLTSEALSCN